MLMHSYLASIDRRIIGSCPNSIDSVAFIGEFSSSFNQTTELNNPTTDSRSYITARMYTSYAAGSFPHWGFDAPSPGCGHVGHAGLIYNFNGHTHN